MNTHYTQENRDPSFWDTVIPHYIDPDEFLYSSDKSNYGLFLGRIIPSKGIGIILDLAKKLPDTDFVIAGNGNVDQNKLPNNVKFVGVVKGEEKKNLLTNAKFLIAPSLYNEPFGLIVPESLVSGTPVITTDWGGFVENNKHEHTGFRCRTFDQFVHAIRNIDKIKNEDCKNFALNNFSINCAKKRYIDYFKILENRYTKGYYYESKKFLNSTCEIVL
jgi:glycosyltransferase involved in cell wall biosynthesis